MAAPSAPPAPQLVLLRQWSCSHCSAVNHRLRLRCFKCDRAKRNPQLPPGPWRCKRTEGCNALNHELRSHCFHCTVAREDPYNAYPSGPWDCLAEGCRAKNHPMRLRCFHCDAARPLYEPLWFCMNCERNVFDHNCDKCGDPRAPEHLPNFVTAVPANVQPQALTPEQLMRAGRFGGDEERLVYKGQLEVGLHLRPTEPLRTEARTLGDLFVKIGVIVDECERVIASRREGNDQPQHGLSDDEELALTMYTFDFGTAAPREHNFYFTLNTLLRQRAPDIMARLGGYLWHMNQALTKLPNVETTVYRGYENADFVRREYRETRRIHWSSFSSSTTLLETACAFAGTDGKGALLEIKIATGKCIRDYSVYAGENEILLHPNTAFVVVETTQQPSFFHVKLVEITDTVRS